MRLSLFLSLGLWFAFSGWRLQKEFSSSKKAGATKTVLLSKWDPRDQARLHEILRLRESESFRAQLKSGLPQKTYWTSFSSAVASWTWLELLQGLHNEASYQGDYSWVFAKLYYLLENTPDEELQIVSALAPFFLVIGKDMVGAQLIMNELVRRAEKSWIPWFWYGFYANDRMNSRRFAADLFERAARLPGAPFYTAALAMRLRHGAETMDNATKRKLVEDNLDPEFLEKLKVSRPEWFK